MARVKLPATVKTKLIISNQNALGSELWLVAQKFFILCIWSTIDMTLVPGIPYGHSAPVVAPLHLEKAEAALLENLHAIAVDTHLGVG
jgi:hypothetical protein